MKRREVIPTLKKCFARYLPVQPTHNSYIRLALSIFTNQIVILIIIFTSLLNDSILQLQDEIYNSIYFAICSLRVALSISYVVFKKQELIMTSKIIICLIMIFSIEKKLGQVFGTLCIAVQIISRTVWTLVQDQRFNTNPLIGRVNLINFWTSEVCLVLMGELYLYEGNFRIFMINVLLAIRVWSCWNDTIYNLRLKGILKNLELGNLILGIFTLFFGAPKYVLMSIPLILIIFATGFIKISYCDQLIQIEKRMQKYNRNQVTCSDMYKYLLILNYLLYEKNQQQLKRFLFFHLQSCDNSNCKLNQMKKRMKQEKDKNWQDENLLQFCRLYLETCIFALQVKDYNYTKLKIFLSLPSMRVYKYLNADNFIQYRELERIKNQYTVTQNNVELNVNYSEQINEKAEIILNKLHLNFQKLFLEVNKKLLNYNKILHIMHKIEQLKVKIVQLRAYNNLLTTKSRFILNQIFGTIIKEQPKLENLNIMERLMVVGQEVGLTLIASAELENFGTIVNANKETVRWLYIPKKTLLTLKIDDLVPADMKVVHRHMLLRKKDQVASFNKSIDFPQILYVTNAQGYIVPFQSVVRRFCSIQGRKWHLVFYPAHVHKPTLIVGMDGTILGVNQACISYGFDKSMINQRIPNQFYRDIIHQGTANQPTAEQQQKFSKILKLKKLEQHTRIKRYYVVEAIIKQDQKTQTDRSQLEQSKIQISNFNFQSNLYGNYFGKEDKNYFEKIEILDLNALSNSRRKTSKSSFLFRPAQLEIEELILYQGKIDHKKNVVLRQQEEDSFKLVKKNQEKQKILQMSEQLFLQKMKKLQTNKPRWLILFIIFMVVIILLTIGLKIFTLVLHLDNLGLAQDKNQCFIMFNQQMSNYASLGIMPFLQKQFPNTNTSSYNQIFKMIEQNWKKLEVLQPHLDDLLKNNFKSKDQTISDSLKNLIEDYTIFVRDYSLNPKQQTLSKIIEYSKVLNNGFMTLIDKMYSNYHSQFEMYLNLYICLKMLLVVFLLAYCGFIAIQSYRSKNQKNQVLEIVSKISSQDLKSWIAFNTQIIKFAQFSLVSQQKKKLQEQPQQICSSQKSLTKSNRSLRKIITEKKMRPIKKAQQEMMYLSNDVIKSVKNAHIYLQIIVLLIISAILWQNIYNQVMLKVVEHHSFTIQLSLVGAMYKISSSFLMIQRGIFYNIDTKVFESQIYFQNMLESLQTIDSLFQKGIQQDCFTENFELFYDQYWTGKACVAIDSKICPKTEFYGSAKEGISTMLSSIMLKYYELTFTIKNRQAVVLKMSKIVQDKNKYQKVYIDKFISQTIQNYQQLKKIWKQTVLKYFVWSWIIIIVCLIAGVFIMVIELQKTKIMNQGLINFDFEHLKKLSNFNRKLDSLQ